jgi:stearoyl-CoA desaturase (delta-9 desaturase)
LEALGYLAIFMVAHWYLSLFCQTFYLHRYSAHKMFTMSPFWEKFFYALTWITQGSSFLSPRAYAILHRMHHEYSDTHDDPHSPHHTDNVLTMMWKTKIIYNNVLKWRVRPEDKFLGDYPEWDAMDRLADSWTSRIGWVLFYIAIYALALPVTMWWIMPIAVPIHALMGPIHGAIVNWSGHKYGYSNWDNGDKSKNTLFADVLLLGELFQNNHHYYPLRPNFATKWWEFDPTYPVIKALNAVGVIKISNSPAAQMAAAPIQPRPDYTTVEAVKIPEELSRKLNKKAYRKREMAKEMA